MCFDLDCLIEFITPLPPDISYLSRMANNRLKNDKFRKGIMQIFLAGFVVLGLLYIFIISIATPATPAIILNFYSYTIYLFFGIGIVSFIYGILSKKPLDILFAFMCLATVLAVFTSTLTYSIQYIPVNITSKVTTTPVNALSNNSNAITSSNTINTAYVFGLAPTAEQVNGVELLNTGLLIVGSVFILIWDYITKQLKAKDRKTLKALNFLIIYMIFAVFFLSIASLTESISVSGVQLHYNNILFSTNLAIYAVYLFFGIVLAITYIVWNLRSRS